MSDDEAIEFLRTVQPLPDDSNLSAELIRRFDEVREHFVNSPNELAVPLLLNSFGDGDGFGVYQLVEDAIAAVDPDKVIPHIVAALASANLGVRYWTAQIAANYNDRRLLAPLLNLLDDKSEDVRMAALIAAKKYADISNVDVFKKLRARETSQEIRQLYDEIIGN